MAKLFNGSINFPSTMTPTGAQPLDDRSVVKTLSDLLSSDTFGTALYNGMMVSVVDEQKVYMLIDDTKSTSEEGWVAVGSGNGSVAVETYAEAVEMATDDNIGQVIYVKNESEYDADGEEGEGVAVKYDAAPYIVIGSGELMKLAASTASGDINSEVASLKTKISALETAIGDEESGLINEINNLEDAIVSADTVSKGYASAAESAAKSHADSLNESMNSRVEALEEVSHSHDNMDVLTGITSESVEKWNKGEANIIEKIVFNGEEVSVDNQTKTVTLNTPSDYITGLTENNILSVSDGKLTANLDLNYLSSGDTHEIQLVGKDGSVIGRVDASNFVKDGILHNVELKENPSGQTEGTYLIFTWNDESGKSEPMYVPVTSLIDVYNAGNGIDLNGKTFSLSLRSNEKYLEVNENGLASKGIDDAILASKNALLGSDSDESSSNTIYGAKKYAEEKSSAAESAAKSHADGLNESMNSRVEALEEVSHSHDNMDVLTGITSEDVEKWDSSIQDISINGIDAVINGNSATIKIKADDIELGTPIMNGDEVKYSGDTKISAVLQSIQESIRGAIAGGVNSVSSGDEAIVVNSADANNPIVTLKVEETTVNTVSDGHIAMIKGNNGLYGVMYYGGDDAE